MGGETKIPACNCGCNEIETETWTEPGKFGPKCFVGVEMRCANCGFVVCGVDHDFDRAEKRAIEKWCLWLKTKDYHIWKMGKKNANSL